MKPENLEPYEQWQIEKYGNVLPELNIPNDAKLENGIEEERRFSEWMQYEAEQQMLMDEYYSDLNN